MPTAEKPPSRDDVRTAIVDAAARLLHEVGTDGVTTRAVAAAAGVQAPTIYRLFGDKDGLVDAVAEHVMATYVAAKTPARDAEDPDPVADLRAGWLRHVEFGLANPDLYVLMNARRGVPSPATLAGIEVLRAKLRRLAAAGLLRVAEERALSMVHAAGNGVVLSLLQAAEGERDHDLAEAMWETVVAGILVEAPATTDGSTTAVTVTFATLVPQLPGLTEGERALMGEWLHRSLAARGAAAPS